MSWRGHDRHRDLPMLGIDPDAKSDWVPVDDGRRPDNRGPEEFVEAAQEFGGFGYAGPVQVFSRPFEGARPDIGPITGRGEQFTRRMVFPNAGRDLMEYHRKLAMAQVMSVKSEELTLRTVGF